MHINKKCAKNIGIKNTNYYSSITCINTNRKKGAFQGRFSVVFMSFWVESWSVWVLNNVN